MKIILGSSSVPRQKILKDLGYEFEVVKPDLDEKSIRRDNPRELVLALANAKADNVISKITGEAIVITADSVVLVNGEVKEKPVTKDEAYQFLREVSSGVPQTLVSALAVTNTVTGKRLTGVDEGTVIFSEIPEAVIKNFVESGEALNHAGAFAIQNPIFYDRIKEIKGEFETIAGLSKTLVQKFIKELL